MKEKRRGKGRPVGGEDDLFRLSAAELRRLFAPSASASAEKAAQRRTSQPYPIALAIRRKQKRKGTAAPTARQKERPRHFVASKGDNISLSKQTAQSLSTRRRLDRRKTTNPIGQKGKRRKK